MKSPRKRQTQEFYTMQQAADVLNVHYKYIYKLVNTGEIQCVRIGKGIRRIRITTFNEWIEKKEINGV